MRFSWVVFTEPDPVREAISEEAVRMITNCFWEYPQHFKGCHLTEMIEGRVRQIVNQAMATQEKIQKGGG